MRVADVAPGHWPRVGAVAFHSMQFATNLESSPYVA